MKTDSGSIQYRELTVGKELQLGANVFLTVHLCVFLQMRQPSRQKTVRDSKDRATDRARTTDGFRTNVVGGVVQRTPIAVSLDSEPPSGRVQRTHF